jgi:hypothetical protein
MSWEGEERIKYINRKEEEEEESNLYRCAGADMFCRISSVSSIGIEPINLTGNSTEITRYLEEIQKTKENRWKNMYMKDKFGQMNVILW